MRLCPRCGEDDVAWLQPEDGSEAVHCNYCGASDFTVRVTVVMTLGAVVRVTGSKFHGSSDNPVEAALHGRPVQRRCPMLAISRKKNESVMIGDDITVTVIEIRGDKVRLGFETPRRSASIAERCTRRSRG